MLRKTGKAIGCFCIKNSGCFKQQKKVCGYILLPQQYKKCGRAGDWASIILIRKIIDKTESCPRRYMDEKMPVAVTNYVVKHWVL